MSKRDKWAGLDLEVPSKDMPEDAFTTEEFRKRYGLCIAQARALLYKMRDEGKVEAGKYRSGVAWARWWRAAK